MIGRTLGAYLIIDGAVASGADGGGIFNVVFWFSFIDCGPLSIKKSRRLGLILMERYFGAAIVSSIDITLISGIEAAFACCSPRRTSRVMVEGVGICSFVVSGEIVSSNAITAASVDASVATIGAVGVLSIADFRSSEISGGDSVLSTTTTSFDETFCTVGVCSATDTIIKLSPDIRLMESSGFGSVPSKTSDGPSSMERSAYSDMVDNGIFVLTVFSCCGVVTIRAIWAPNGFTSGLPQLTCGSSFVTSGNLALVNLVAWLFSIGLNAMLFSSSWFSRSMTIQRVLRASKRHLISRRRQISHEQLDVWN